MVVLLSKQAIRSVLWQARPCLLYTSTLHLRVPRHCENAQKVAEFLEAHDKVKWVNYPGLKSNKYYDLAQKYMPNGTCGVISFAVDGTKEDTVRFMDALRLAAIVTHVADARTCVLHPASHTHRRCV